MDAKNKRVTFNGSTGPNAGVACRWYCVRGSSMCKLIQYAAGNFATVYH